jgi:hypothetical protein
MLQSGKMAFRQAEFSGYRGFLRRGTMVRIIFRDGVMVPRVLFWDGAGTMVALYLPGDPYHEGGAVHPSNRRYMASGNTGRLNSAPAHRGLCSSAASPSFHQPSIQYDRTGPMKSD